MKLNDYLTLVGLSPSRFAEAVAINRSTLWRIRRGKQRPNWTTLEAITRETKGAVTANDFVGNAR